ncbi:Acyl-CoA N-acyltransferase protein [Melia azedarach]|uniref:Acyl-CoA N-acyltransferase protein n=1 Tax=Melia azedarach TaxID=155640 RepID=A0ACC1XS60_MELAZ|nr:Acyl-CoA N-acyltransferase protein [Melia azedarach]
MAQMLLSYSSTTLKYSGYGRKSAFEKSKGSFVVHCCSFSSTKEVGLVGKDATDNGKVLLKEKENKQQFEYLASDFGWKVRRLDSVDDEMREVAFIQAEAFHVPVAFFNDLFFEFFKAEVLSGLLYKLRNSPPNRYACLVAENSNDNIEPQRKLVGVVDVTVLRDEDVLQHIQGGAEEYLYVSGLAVLKRFRRQKIATALLKACEAIHPGFLLGLGENAVFL